MILIPFVPGTFASTVEYVLRKFTVEGQSHHVPFLMPKEDGSMHNFDKIAHIYESAILKETIVKCINTDKILTPIYPFRDLHTKETFDILNNIDLLDNKMVTIVIEDLQMAEINLLFQYYKIVIGLGFGLDAMFNNESTVDDLKQWNSPDKIEKWELREWFSLYYPGWIQEWLDARKYIKDRNIAISNYDLLYNTRDTLDKIIAYCGFTKTNNEQMGTFIEIWLQKQQYILDEYQNINEFVEHTVNNTEFYLQHNNIIAEAIIQQKLRAKGYEIRCWKLNDFPTQATKLHNLLEKL